VISASTVAHSGITFPSRTRLVSQKSFKCQGAKVRSKKHLCLSSDSVYAEDSQGLLHRHHGALNRLLCISSRTWHCPCIGIGPAGTAGSNIHVYLPRLNPCMLLFCGSQHLLNHYIRVAALTWAIAYTENSEEVLCCHVTEPRTWYRLAQLGSDARYLYIGFKWTCQGTCTLNLWQSGSAKPPHPGGMPHL